MRPEDIEIEECEGVYPPREDTYLLANAIETGPGQSFLEIGTGSGLVAIWAALQGADVVATDISEKALECARRNAERNGAGIHFIHSDMGGGIGKRFHRVAFNAPYLPESNEDYGEIKGALESEQRGSGLARKYVERLPELLLPEGRAYLVISSLTDRSFMQDTKDVVFTELARKHIFFEDIFVFMLSLRKDL